ncbi:TPA: cadherin repeat domain-containing protein [Vibrio harveyi]|nr:cadherin repeat domain-containing protein [Vibrio harveyi]
MKRLFLASLVSATLIGCGGSDGGSKPTPPPVKPETPQEVITDLATYMGIPEDRVRDICSDVAFTCTSEADEVRGAVSTSITDSQNLLGFGTTAKGEFWNDGEIVFKDALKPTEDLQPPAFTFALEIEGEVVVSRVVKGVDVEYNQETQSASVDLTAWVDVHASDMSNFLNQLSVPGVKANLTATLDLKKPNSESKVYEYKRDLDSEGFKAVFLTLQEKNEAFYEEPKPPVDPETPNPEPNKAPVVQPLKNSVVKVGEHEVQQIVWSDEGDVTFNLESKADFITVSSTGGIGFNNPTDKNIGSHTYKVVVSDGSLETVVEGKVVVVQPLIPTNPDLVNHAPVWNELTVSPVNEGDWGSIWLSASDANGDALIYSLVSAPEWVTIPEGSDHLDVKPSYEDSGEHEIVVSVSDGSFNVKKTINLVVNNVNRAPEFTKYPEDTVRVTAGGEPVTVEVMAKDADGDAITYNLIDAPKWASIEKKTGVITLAPDRTVGDFHNYMTVAAHDGITEIQSGFYVQAVEENRFPDIYEDGDKLHAVVGEKYTINLRIVDSEDDVVIPTLHTSANFMELKNNPTSDDYYNWYIEVTPQSGDEGEYEYYVSATDDAQYLGNAGLTYKVVVDPKITVLGLNLNGADTLSRTQDGATTAHRNGEEVAIDLHLTRGGEEIDPDFSQCGGNLDLKIHRYSEVREGWSYADISYTIVQRDPFTNECVAGMHNEQYLAKHDGSLVYLLGNEYPDSATGGLEILPAMHRGFNKLDYPIFTALDYMSHENKGYSLELPNVEEGETTVTIKEIKGWCSDTRTSDTGSMFDGKYVVSRGSCFGLEGEHANKYFSEEVGASSSIPLETKGSSPFYLPDGTMALLVNAPTTIEDSHLELIDPATGEVTIKVLARGNVNEEFPHYNNGYLGGIKSVIGNLIFGDEGTIFDLEKDKYVMGIRDAIAMSSYAEDFTSYEFSLADIEGDYVYSHNGSEYGEEPDAIARFNYKTQKLDVIKLGDEGSMLFQGTKAEWITSNGVIYKAVDLSNNRDVHYMFRDYETGSVKTLLTIPAGDEDSVNIEIDPI